MPDVLTSPLLELAGAVEADAPDSGVAAHYGEPFVEQRRLAAGQGFVDLSHRDVIAVAGVDRLPYLHSLTTQAFEGLEPDRQVEALILSPHGHIEHAFDAVDDGEVTWLHTEPGAGAELAGFLDRMRFMSRVTIDLRPDRAVVGLPGRTWTLLDRGQLADAEQRWGQPAGLWAWEAFRIAAGAPRLGWDTDERTIPNEVGLLERAVHLDKGCYRGQETVARVHNLGRPPRRVVLLHLDGSVERLPARGAEVSTDDGVVGWVGSSARHFELGPIALALVKRKTPVEAALMVDGIAASQEAVVDPEVGLHVRDRLR